MLKSRLLLSASVLLSASALVPILRADDAPTVGGIAPRPIVDISAAGSDSKFVPDEPSSKGQVTISRSDSPAGVVVTMAPGEAGYPGASLKPEGGTPWDFSPFGRIEATITNTGTKKLGLGMRVDDSGGYQNNNASVTYIDPGQTVVCKVTFGYSFGNPAQMIKTSSIAQILLFGGKVKGDPQSFRIESIEAAGVAGEKLPVKPGSLVIVPKDGVVLGAGAEKLDAGKNLVNKGATGTLVDASGSQNLKIEFTAGSGKQEAGIKPDNGKWALYNGLEIRAKVRNDGQSPITPTLHVDSQGGPIDAKADAPLAPGAETELVASYINPQTWKNTPPSINPDPGTGNKFTSNQVTGILIGAASDTTARTLTVESIKADLPTPNTPDWLGKKPPVDGEWTQTFNDDFDGATLDMTKWNNTNHDNYWDKRSHWDTNNLILKDGTITLHYEKKTGYMNGDTTNKQTDYAVGYLDSYGKWVQRYGYFEARVKNPKAPGLWPAFWLMPDRGEAAGPQWKRADTANGGMEFDIMEFLSGWGPWRYNIAMHWDGYGKNHKSTGSPVTYGQPDKDGFLTAGLLWLPGKAIYYCNGVEVLHFESDRVSTVPSHFIIDMVSGGWDNQPLDDAKLPDDFVVDYVRAWQRKDLASDVDGFKKSTK